MTSQFEVPFQAVDPISRSVWNDGFGAHSGPSPGDSCSVRAGQGLAGAHFRRSRMRAFARMRSFLMMATMATLAGFPALTMASYLALNSGLHRMALRAGM